MVQHYMGTLLVYRTCILPDMLLVVASPKLSISSVIFEHVVYTVNVMS